MKVLILGSGGREHAFAWKMAQSPQVQRVFAAPGNPGIATVGTCVPLGVDAIDELVAFAKKEAIDLTVVGPEYPLTLGVVDRFEEEGLPIFGPRKAAARLEGSKAFAKEIMIEAGVPTAGYQQVTTREEAERVCAEVGVPVVLKADGLAAGKGVYVCHTEAEVEEAQQALFDTLGASSVVIEEFLLGKEASYIVATDGETVVPMAASHDYKRIFDGDKGNNTGGMGTVSPTPNLTRAQEQWALEQVITPVIKTMAARGCPFKGFVYAGLMIQPDGEIKVLEFNARCGDPETQVIMRRMESDFFALLHGLATGDGAALPPQQWSEDSAVCVVMASAGYPESSSKGDVITGIELTTSLPGTVVFHAGTTLNDKNEVVTNGGRVLGVTGMGSDQEAARRSAYQAADMIQFKGRQLRRDIGALTD